MNGELEPRFAAPLAANPALPPAKILLVDDQPKNLLALSAMLEPLEQEVIQASSGKEALRYLLRDEFALVLLDVQMPVLDGYEVAELIIARQAEELRRASERELADFKRSSEQRYTMLAESMPQVVWTTDSEGVLRY